nr:methyltransferase [Haliscomenobacter sp.]
MRKPFQGVLNIVRFNWHFYVFAFALVLGLFFVANYFAPPVRTVLIGVGILATASTLISLLASFYVYDLAGLYNFTWLDQQNATNTVVNINAGFDETSTLLKAKFKAGGADCADFMTLRTLKFPSKEQRKPILRFPGHNKLKPNLQLLDDSVDKIFVILSAHEIRDESERVTFFKALKRAIKPLGKYTSSNICAMCPIFWLTTSAFFTFMPNQPGLKLSGMQGSTSNRK